jgi:hypothetical protein
LELREIEPRKGVQRGRRKKSENEEEDGRKRQCEGKAKEIEVKRRVRGNERSGNGEENT